MNTRLQNEELVKYHCLSRGFSDFLDVNDFIDDLIRKWLKTFKTNENIYSTFKISKLYPFNDNMTKRFLLRIYHLIYVELNKVVSYKFRLFDLVEMICVPENASQMFRNWSIKCENGYVCLYRENINQKLETIKLHWDDCVNFAKKCYEQTGYIDDNCMYIIVHNYDNDDEYDFFGVSVNESFSDYDLTFYDNKIQDISEHIMYKNNSLKIKMLDIIKLGKLEIEIVKYDSDKKLNWTVKYEL